MRVWFVVPVHGREALTRVCLRQLRRTCDALQDRIEATAVVIGEGALLGFAQELGFATVERDNHLLGRKFNDGYQLACDPNYNPEPADYVIPCGSDDWVDPQIIQPDPTRIVCFKQLAVVNETRDQLARLQVGYVGGVGIRIIPRRLLSLTDYRPAIEDAKRAIDTGTLRGLIGVHGRELLAYRDVHPLQIVDWKTRGQQLNSFEMLRGYQRGTGEDPYEALADVYPAEALEEMRAL